MRLTTRRLTETAGWIGVGVGAAHTVLATIGSPVSWREIVSEGWWHTFTLTATTTLAEAQRAESFWFGIGSFGVPLCALGAYTVWAARQDVRVPGWVGGIVAAWGLALSTALPASPGWSIPVMGGLLAWADARRIRPAGAEVRELFPVTHHDAP